MLSYKSGFGTLWFNCHTLIQQSINKSVDKRSTAEILDVDLSLYQAIHGLSTQSHLHTSPLVVLDGLEDLEHEEEGAQETYGAHGKIDGPQYEPHVGHVECNAHKS